MTDAEVLDSPPPPRPTFDALPLTKETRRALDAMGYSHPTPVQLAVYEPATRGKNLVVQARTGTGKTASFSLPIVDQLVRRSETRVQALVLTPTRELALQVSSEMERIGQFRGVRVTPIYGGAPMGRQVDALDAGTHVVVGTPGRVLDHIRRGSLVTDAVRIFVLDEADEMLSMGFAKELHAIASALPKERQGLFFSATIPPDIERLAHAQLKDPEFITLSSDQVGAREVAHYVYILRSGDKRDALVRIVEVEDPESAIVFCNTKDETERVATALQNRGYDADWLNGDMEQRERERVMTATREGKLRFLVATDVAARGIDISHLTHVINADFPADAESYVHRTGRTGRAGRTGTAISLVGPKDVGSLYMLRLTYDIRPIERQLPSETELRTRAELDLVQFFVEAFGGRPCAAEDLALARRLLTHADGERIVAALLRDHLGAKEARTAGGKSAAGRSAAEQAAEARRARPPTPVSIPADSPERAPEDDGAAPISKDVPTLRRGAATRRDDDRSERSERRERPERQHHPTESAPEERRPSELRSEERRPELRAEMRRERRDPASADRPTRESSREGEPSRRGTLPAAGVPEDFVSVYVNVGKREGLSASDVEALLSRGGVLHVRVGAIRLRDRMTFVDVPRSELDRACAALSGHDFGGRVSSAEVARER